MTHRAGNPGNIAWIRQTWSEIGVFGTGSTYMKFTGRAGEATSADVDNAFGRTLRLLIRIKAAYDRGDFFCLNSNILPRPRMPLLSLDATRGSRGGREAKPTSSIGPRRSRELECPAVTLAAGPVRRGRWMAIAPAAKPGPAAGPALRFPHGDSPGARGDVHDQNLARCEGDDMTQSVFPSQIRELPPFDGPFDAYRLAAEACDVLFATYPAGTKIGDHHHDTDNVGVVTVGELILRIDGTETRHRPGDWYHVPPRKTYAAGFELDGAGIEFWFRTTTFSGAADA
jgi:Cupin domain